MPAFGCTWICDPAFADYGVPLDPSASTFQALEKLRGCEVHASPQGHTGVLRRMPPPPHSPYVTPAFGSQWSQSTQVAASSHTVSMEQQGQPKECKASRDDHNEGPSNASTGVQQRDVTATIKAYGPLLNEEPDTDIPSAAKEDGFCVTGLNNLSNKREAELLLLSIYNLSTVLERKFSKNPNCLDVHLLESAITLLSSCLLKQPGDSAMKSTCKLSTQFPPSCQDSSSKPDATHCPCVKEPSFKPEATHFPSAMANTNAAPPAGEALLRHETDQRFNEADIKPLHSDERDSDFSASDHKTGGVLDGKHRSKMQDVVQSTTREHRSCSSGAHGCDPLVSDAAGETTDQLELHASLNGSADLTLDTHIHSGEAVMETILDGDSDSEGWEYVISTSPAIDVLCV